MRIKKEELSDLLFWKYGVLEGERERSKKYIEKIEKRIMKICRNEIKDCAKCPFSMVKKKGKCVFEEAPKNWKEGRTASELLEKMRNG